MDGGTEEIIDYEIGLLVLRILTLGVTPTIAALGIVGNCFGVAVLVKQGLRKSSNILLVTLALADIAYLISFNGERLIMYHVIDLRGFDDFSEQRSQDLMSLYCVFFYLDYTAGTTSFTLPVLITVERLVAVFFPLSFNRIITPKRAWFVVSIICLLWLSLIMYPSFWLEIRFIYDFENTSVPTAVMERTNGFDNDSALEFIEQLLLYCAMMISPILTASGCLVISIKLKVEAMKRKKMTSKDVSLNRTTMMLLAVCAVYVVTTAVLTLLIYLPDYIVSTAFTDRSPSNLSKIMYQIINTFECVNSSCNFVVYVGLNKRFRQLFKDLFCCYRKSIDKRRGIRFEQ